MKLDKDNKIKLAKNERRIGNFVIKNEAEHVKVMDIGQLFTHRAAKSTPIGQYLEICYDALEKGDSTGMGLRNWISVIFAAFSVIPDIEFLERVIAECEACLKRHPEVYGAPDGPGTDDENAEAEAEAKEMMEFEEDLKKMPDAEQEADSAGA